MADDLSLNLPQAETRSRDSRPILDRSRLSRLRQNITRTLNNLVETNTVNQIPDSSGVMQTAGTQKVVNHIEALNEQVIENGPAKIVLGADTPIPVLPRNTASLLPSNVPET